MNLNCRVFGLSEPGIRDIQVSFAWWSTVLRDQYTVNDEPIWQRKAPC